ncbi:hypothetical protein COY52_02730 [Candidatus Desantisbacteria bacterium CG_4_10_14_0_8_um_filter_48_22]|uniref:Glycoside hydrolase family 5 domain-containing protein n=1 Tax=Candidatus Desantisbacteria bacterium CG_4_10_14_0_8_um_filter_48_22 TaxID=1974543 RepID=A0A2M7SE96_9BACT|nr:MAG: hypothetical protein AUJ67_02040 [Candidatus Desantisbacteria bacterium CG1_02_49_89]PIV55812.1 MAG: hypothetical protein COS16_05970 [Candidatus Desantisbacteria bacterium CG02_land_8_20_14_3_00_49_13]PIZ17801.1 MAG: hypothetical protein COY52_02730 [Candidatus Desantisbacteria bacterium CG_4_10_14_0_8_um_filter_48_22]
MVIPLVLTFSFCLPYTLHLIRPDQYRGETSPCLCAGWALSTVCWAEDASCEFTKLPSEVGEGEKFEVTVSYDIPEDAGQQILQCEMKDKDSVNVLKAQSPRVKGKGEKTLTFVAPKMDQMEAIVMACWAGTDWQNPVAPIKFSDPIPVVEKRSAPQPKEEKKEASKSEETSKISVESVSKLEIFSKSEVKESGEPPGKEATCAIADLPGEVVEGKEFMTTVEYSIPSSAGKARLNCEMKDMSNNVLKSESPEVKGKGKATFSFTAPVLSTGQVVIAAWLGQDWQQPLAPIQFSEPIPITGKEMSGMPGGKPDVEKGKNGSIAVFRDSLPGMDGTGIADAVVTGLRGSGFGVTVLDSEKIRNSSILNIENFDCLVIAGGADYFPASASASLLRFLTRGGDLVTLGGYAFKELVWNFNGKWMTKSQIEETISSVQPQNMLFDFEDEPSGWRRATNDVSTPGSLEADKGYKGKGAKIFIPGLTGWDNWSAGIDGSISEGQDLVCFWAKGSQRTKQIAVEIGERDGSRWIATVNMGTEWKHYCLLPEAFAYWKDNTSKGRGGKGDAVKLENASIISIGLAYSHTSVEGGQHEIWIDEVGIAKNPYPKMDLTARMKVPVFNDAYSAYVINDVAKAEINSAQALLESGLNLAGVTGGDFAIAYPNQTGGRYVPLINAYDKYGRYKGAIASMLVNYSKAMKNSVIACFGIKDPGFYKDPSFIPALSKIIGAMKNGLFLGSISPGRLTYEPGKEALFSARVCNLGSAAKQANAEISVVKDGKTVFSKAFEIGLEPGKNQAVECGWVTPMDAGSYMLRVVLRESGKGVSDIAEHMFDVAPMPPVQQGFMKVSADKKHLVYPDGKRFFCIGSNYHGWFDRCWNEWKEYFDPVKMELDFRKAHEAGINTFRLFLYKLADDIMKDDFHKIDIMLTFARRYDIHLLVHLARYGQMEKSQECIRKLCAHLKDEPMVLGYDIQNEPWLPAIIAEKYPAGIKLPITDIQDGVNKFGIYVGENLGEWTTFPKLKDNKVPMLDDEVVKAGDESFRIWIKLNKDAIREVDKNHLVTVGFNTPFSAFPCASELDFISHHVYVRPFSYDSVIQNITTFDRIAAVWPEKPVSFGEFGYSNGIMMGSRYLDFYSSAVGEMIHYLYPLSRGYEGSYKWMLNDNPNAWRGDDNFYEERFGFFYYDGTPFGHRKPIAHATQFLSEYINRAGPTGTMETAQAQNMIGTGYVFKGDKALFIGNTEYKSDGLQFKGGKPANVMLDWGSGKLKIMSTCDLQVKISPSKFLSTLKSGSKITGRNAGSKKDGDLLILDLLEGEAVTIQ